MTWAEFKKKWHRYQGKESSAYQEHFNDLCRLLGHPTPVEADPSGEDFFCFQKGVIKDLELLDLASGDKPKKGIADVWKKDFFGWEYKGKHKSLGEAYQQLQQYRESLFNPPLLVVCDFDRYIIRTNFTGTVREEHEFTNDQIDRPENLALLRYVFFDPYYLKPQRTTAQVTRDLAERFAQVARSLQKRESVEYADARTRAEVVVAQKKNLRIARFLNRLVFCFFAEDTGLLPKKLFSEIAKIGLEDKQHFIETLQRLFHVMAKGGTFGQHKIRHFDGHLFDDSTVFDLSDEERRILAEASEADWQFVEPSIMGTLFARGLDPDQRAALGAQFTGREDIVTIVEPVLMAPLRREWAALKTSLLPAFKRSKGMSADRGRLASFLKKLRQITVLDPACGSGNFLYVSLQMLLDLEKEVIAFATQLGFRFEPAVDVQQLRAIEINPYAFELAQVSVQIGYLQWRRDNGFDNDRTPVLQVLDGFENKDALLNQTFRKKPKSLKEAQAEEHADDQTIKVYTERAWPECDAIVSNPPFLGTKKLRGELGDDYVDELFRVYANRIPNFSDLCCYWFEKARDLIDHQKCSRAGLLATQGIRGGLNREVLKRIKETGDIFFAESDREWILDGASVHVSMVGFDAGNETSRVLDGKKVREINSNLTTAADTTKARRLASNRAIGFIADVKAGKFEMEDEAALAMLAESNPNCQPSSDILLPWINSLDILRRPRNFWIVDFGADGSLEASAQYATPFAHVKTRVFPLRSKVKRKSYREYWWLHAEPCAEMREQIAVLERFLVTTTVSKHRIFAWEQAPTLPDHQLVAFARGDDYFFGVLHSRLHEVWSLAQGTQLREKESGFRYTPTTCFETFPFPFSDDLQPRQPASAPTEPSPEPPVLNGGLGKMVTKRFLEVKEEPPSYGVSERGVHAASTSGLQATVKRPEGRAPLAPAEHRAAIAAAAKELNELREHWLNPPEWTRTEILEFPASTDGPWARYVECGGKRSAMPLSPAAQSAVAAAALPAHSKIGIARYPRLVPKDAECAAKLKPRTLTNLYNERPAWLDLAHKKLDAAVAAAYGFPADLTDEQILERLLALNLERAAEEAKSARKPIKRAQREKAEHEMI